jgi:F-type H+-transporting ATPase subunit delta
VRELALAHRYAEALFLAALERKELEPVAGDVAAALLVFERNPRFGRLLESPQVPTEDKEKVVGAVFGGKAHRLVGNMILLLLHKQRVTRLRDVFRRFLERVEEHQGITTARVLTAVPLAQDAAAELRRRLEARTGKSVQLKMKVVEELIGGITVHLGHKILDGSLRHELAEVKKRLLETSIL